MQLFNSIHSYEKYIQYQPFSEPWMGCSWPWNSALFHKLHLLGQFHVIRDRLLSGNVIFVLHVVFPFCLPNSFAISRVDSLNFRQYFHVFLVNLGLGEFSLPFLELGKGLFIGGNGQRYVIDGFGEGFGLDFHHSGE